MTDHLQGKTVVEHLKDARKKGAFASAEIHGVEMPGHLSSGCDAAKETAFVLLLLWILFGPWLQLILFAAGWCVWKIGRSALLGWTRLERLHRVIEEERWEIQHNREQEKAELRAMYEAKGLKGKLLDEVVSILMADDNRLLRIMLEEEMGLTLEVFEHPLKQSFGAAVGVIATAALFWLGSFFPYGTYVASIAVMTCASLIGAKIEKNRVMESLIWTLAVASFAITLTYFLEKAVVP